MNKPLRGLLKIFSMDKNNIAEALDDIMLDITWAKVSKRYFGKSASWIYHKIAGSDGQRKVEFTNDELKILKSALNDLADRLRKAAEKI